MLLLTYLFFFKMMRSLGKAAFRTAESISMKLCTAGSRITGTPEFLTMDSMVNKSRTTEFTKLSCFTNTKDATPKEFPN